MTLTATLIHPDGSSLLLSPSSGYVIVPDGFDRGAPQMREQVFNIPFSDGTQDNTTLIGARNITLNLRLVPSLSGISKEAMRRQLLRYMAPSLMPPDPLIGPRRAKIRFTLDDQAQVETEIRPSNFSVPVGRPGYADITMQWVAPSGIFESPSLSSSGLKVPSTNPESPTVFTVVNSGDAMALPLLQLVGEIDSPTIVNATSGERFALNTFTVIPDDHSYVVDMRRKTVKMDESGGSGWNISKADEVDPENSSWWALYPGTNIIHFYVDAYTGGDAGLLVFWRNSYL